MVCSSFKMFGDFVKTMEAAYSDREISLEEYLTNIWFDVLKHKEEAVTCELIFSILERAFVSQNHGFDDEWLAYTKPADIHYDEKTHKVILEDGTSDFLLLKQTLLFQIAELHRMKERGDLNLPDYDLYGGIETPSGYRWYNFNPILYLKVIHIHCFPEESVVDRDHNLDWLNLEGMLEVGRTFE